MGFCNIFRKYQEEKRVGEGHEDTSLRGDKKVNERGFLNSSY